VRSTRSPWVKTRVFRIARKGAARIEASMARVDEKGEMSR